MTAFDIKSVANGGRFEKYLHKVLDISISSIKKMLAVGERNKQGRVLGHQSIASYENLARKMDCFTKSHDVID